MTISVALGTSTPTSITVVATSHAEPAAGERFHRRVLFGRLEAAVDQPHPIAEPQPQYLDASLGRGEVALLALLDQRTEPIRPARLPTDGGPAR